VGPRGSVMVVTLNYKPEGHGFETRRYNGILSIHSYLSASVGPKVYSASNRTRSPEVPDSIPGANIF
jgi:hypothetical protein